MKAKISSVLVAATLIPPRVGCAGVEGLHQVLDQAQGAAGPLVLREGGLHVAPLPVRRLQPPQLEAAPRPRAVITPPSQMASMSLLRGLSRACPITPLAKANCPCEAGSSRTSSPTTSSSPRGRCAWAHSSGASSLSRKTVSNQWLEVLNSVPLL